MDIYQIMVKHGLYPEQLKNRICRDMKPGNDYERVEAAMKEYAELYSKHIAGREVCDTSDHNLSVTVSGKCFICGSTKYLQNDQY